MPAERDLAKMTAIQCCSLLLHPYRLLCQQGCRAGNVRVCAHKVYRSIVSVNLAPVIWQCQPMQSWSNLVLPHLACAVSFATIHIAEHCAGQWPLSHVTTWLPQCVIYRAKPSVQNWKHENSAIACDVREAKIAQEPLQHVAMHVVLCWGATRSALQCGRCSTVRLLMRVSWRLKSVWGCVTVACARTSMRPAPLPTRSWPLNAGHKTQTKGEPWHAGLQLHVWDSAHSRAVESKPVMMRQLLLLVHCTFSGRLCFQGSLNVGSLGIASVRIARSLMRL